MKNLNCLKGLLGLFLLTGCVECGDFEDRLSNREVELRDRNRTLSRIAKLSVDYISPATGIAEDFRKEYQEDIRKFGILIPDEAFIDKNICRFADTDINRFNRLKRSVYSNSDIVWTTRGGFGSYKLIDRLASLPKPKKRKVFMGFSDITALNLYISQNWKNWTVIHAPMIVYTGKKRYHHPSWSLLMDILEHKVKKYEINGLTPLNKAAKRKICGKLTGGNLTLIESSLGTNWEIATDNKILFVEDCHESAPSVYRSMYHLKAAGKLKKVKAIIFGEFVGSPKYKEFLKHFANEINVPVFITDKFGHGETNLPLVYGAKATIKNNSLVVDLSGKI
jgi:muramoyltetrapeptide carboxypeptidase